MRFFFVLLVFTLSVSEVSAQQLYRYDNRVIDSSIKCDLALVDKTLRKAHPDFKVLNAHMTVTRTDTRHVKIGGKLGLLGNGIGGAYTSDVVSKNTTEFDRNILKANSPNCNKRNLVDLKLYSCFRDALSFSDFDINSKRSKVTCSLDSTATGEGSVGASVKFWVLEADPSGEVSITRHWTVEVVAPPPPDKS